MLRRLKATNAVNQRLLPGQNISRPSTTRCIVKWLDNLRTYDPVGTAGPYASPDLGFAFGLRDTFRNSAILSKPEKMQIEAVLDSFICTYGVGGKVAFEQIRSVLERHDHFKKACGEFLLTDLAEMDKDHHEN